MKSLILIFPIFLLFSCEWDDSDQQSNAITEDTSEQTKAATETTAVQKWLCIPDQRVGGITPTTTEKDLIALYGPDNVTRQQIGLGEGVMVEGTVIFPGSPNQVILEWLPEYLYQKPAIARIEGEKSDWITAEGVQVGTSLSQLLQINEKPIKFYGFEWDYSGLVDDWGGGKIDSSLVVFLAPGNPEVVYPDLLGDQVYSSDHPKASAADLYVLSMMIPLNRESITE